MKKSTMLCAALLLAAAVGPVSAEQFVINGVTMSNVCTSSGGVKFKYDGFYGPVGTPCNWHIGQYEYTGVFGG